jgi:DNA-binding transcriptional regulator LsrR (DeoR family)
MSAYPNGHDFYRTMVNEKEPVIGGAGAHKLSVLCVAVENRFFNVLITDEQSAVALVG